MPLRARPDVVAALRRIQAVHARPTHSTADRERIRAAVVRYLAARDHRSAVIRYACDGPDPEAALDHVVAVAEDGAALVQLADDLDPDGRL